MPAGAVGRLEPAHRVKPDAFRKVKERESSVLQTTPTKLDGLQFLPLAPSATD